LDAHEPPVQLLGDGVELNAALQRLDRGGVAVVLVQLGEPRERVGRAAAQAFLVEQASGDGSTRLLHPIHPNCS